MTTHADSLAPRRKIGFHHLAFLRGYIQQPDLKKWWNAYLFVNGPYEARPAHATLTWLRDELMAAAHRAHRPRIAALLNRDPMRMPQANAPALEQFAKAYPADFYSEADLQALWAQQFGQAGSLAARKQRLMQRQLEALKWLEPLAPPTRSPACSRATSSCRRGVLACGPKRMPIPPLEVVQDVMGHASLNTTTIYVKAERGRRFKEMNRFWDEQMVARDRRGARVE